MQNHGTWVPWCAPASSVTGAAGPWNSTDQRKKEDPGEASPKKSCPQLVGDARPPSAVELGFANSCNLRTIAHGTLALLISNGRASLRTENQIAFLSLRVRIDQLIQQSINLRPVSCSCSGSDLEGRFTYLVQWPVSTADAREGPGHLGQHGGTALALVGACWAPTPLNSVAVP